MYEYAKEEFFCPIFYLCRFAGVGPYTSTPALFFGYFSLTIYISCFCYYEIVTFNPSTEFEAVWQFNLLSFGSSLILSWSSIMWNNNKINALRHSLRHMHELIFTSRAPSMDRHFRRLSFVQICLSGVAILLFFPASLWLYDGDFVKLSLFFYISNFGMICTMFITLQLINLMILTFRLLLELNGQLGQKGLEPSEGRRWHECLCSAAGGIDETYAIPMTAMVIASWSMLTHGVYFILVSAITPRPQSLNSVKFDIIFIYAILLYLCFLFILTHASSKLSEESLKTSIIVHRQLNATDDPLIRDELQLFSLQLLHQRIKFTACGFFNIDYTLLYSVIGAVTTYLIILIQFQMSDKK